MRSAAGTTAIGRSIGGVIACTLASVPLAIGFSLWGFYIDSSDTEWEPGYVLISIVFVTFFSVAIATFCAICVGIPAYVLLSRLNRWRFLTLVVFAVTAAVVFKEIWYGGPAFDDLESTIQFAFFGLYSGIAFWLGAEKWQPIK